MKFTVGNTLKAGIGLANRYDCYRRWFITTFKTLANLRENIHSGRQQPLMVAAKRGDMLAVVKNRDIKVHRSHAVA